MIVKSVGSFWSARVGAEPPDVERPFWRSEDHDLIARTAIVGIFVILAVAALWQAKAIAMPLVGGCLLGVILGPTADRLVKWGVPRSVAAVALVVVVFIAAAFLAALAAAPIALWADQLPSILRTIQERLGFLLVYAKRIEGLAGMINPADAPKVAVAEGSVVAGMIAGSSHVFTGLLLFVATTLAYLATRRRLRARAVRLCLGPAARKSASAFFDEVESRMAAYFGILTLVNVGVGIFAALTAWFFGLPFAAVWGVVAFLLNYVPIIGPVFVTGLMFAAGLLDNGSPWAALLPAAIFYAGHLVESNVATPLAVGRRLTLSPFMVLVSFAFWLWLWGPMGAVLSTPILLFLSLTAEILSDYRNRLTDAEPAIDATAAREPSTRPGVHLASPQVAPKAA